LAEKDFVKVDLIEKAFRENTKNVGKKLLITDLKSKWPFLFEERYLFKQYEKLQDWSTDDFKKKFSKK